MNESEFHKLSDELTARRTATGDVMLYQSRAGGEVHLRQPVAVLTPGEMAGLIAWYLSIGGDECDVIERIVRGLVRGEVNEQSAVIALRALMCRAETRAAGQALEGWVMLGDDV